VRKRLGITHIVINKEGRCHSSRRWRRFFPPILLLLQESGSLCGAHSATADNKSAVLLFGEVCPRASVLVSLAVSLGTYLFFFFSKHMFVGIAVAAVVVVGLKVVAVKLPLHFSVVAIRCASKMKTYVADLH